MGLYLLERLDEVDYEYVEAMVVRAKNEQEARELSKVYTYGWDKVAYNRAIVKCELLEEDGVSEIILTAYH